MTRLVADSGWSMTGGAAQVGSDGVICGDPLRDELAGLELVRARLEEQHDLRQLDDRLRADRLEPSMPASDCSIGTVTSCSTSSAESPMQIVWISTFGGANSGKTSTGIARTCAAPKIIMPAASAMTMKRKRRLVAMIRRIMSRIPPGRGQAGSVTAADADLGAVQLRGARRHDRACPAGGPADRTAVSPSISSTVIAARR